MSNLGNHKYSSFVENLRRHVEANLNNPQFGVEELSEAVNLSRSQLHRKLKDSTGQSISQFIREYRLEKARYLLTKHNLTASEVAYKVGFSSATYFSKSFHDFYGCTPGEVLNKVTEDPLLSKENHRIGYRPYVIGLVILIILLVFLFNYNNSHDVSKKKSIAVLPFTDLSQNGQQQYFADGTMEAVLNHLSDIEELSVISRTTSMRYKGSDKSIPEIANELSVNYVLEGGVQEDNGIIRVNAQLIEAQTDRQLWSQQYDRKLENIFVIQSDIAKSIAEALNSEIAKGVEEAQEPLTQNSVAYENYLRGKYLVEGNWSLDKIIQSRKYFKEAIILDSSFIEPLIWMGVTYLAQGTWYGNLSSEEAIRMANKYLDAAVKIDPNHKEVISNKAALKYFFKWDFEGAEKLFNKLEFDANKVHLNLVLRRYSNVIKQGKEQIEKDPYVGALHWKLAYAYYHTDQVESMRKMIKQGLQIDPNQEAYYDHFGNLYNAVGLYLKAESILSKGLEVSSKRHASMVAHLAIAYDKLNQTDKRDQLLQELRKRAGKGEAMINVFFAHAHAGINEPDSAFYYLDKAYEQREVDLIWLQADPNLLLLKNDPRYKKLLIKIGFPKETWPI